MPVATHGHVPSHQLIPKISSAMYSFPIPRTDNKVKSEKTCNWLAMYNIVQVHLAFAMRVAYKYEIMHFLKKTARF
jgi:hypothetical protein